MDKESTNSNDKEANHGNHSFTNSGYTKDNLLYTRNSRLYYASLISIAQ